MNVGNPGHQYLILDSSLVHHYDIPPAVLT